MMTPRLLTFDIFGTIIDWKEGLRHAVHELGHSLQDEDFDRIIDLQGALESGPFRPYREIVSLSLIQILGIAPKQADAIALRIGEWPLFPDARSGLKKLMIAAPCSAMTNSDRVHANQVQNQLGFKLSDWICAEDLRTYKPEPDFWHATSRRTGASMDRDWWHVSAYADYDLDVARELGLTCVFIPRKHSRPGRAHHTIPDLSALADLLDPTRNPSGYKTDRC